MNFFLWSYITSEVILSDFYVAKLQSCLKYMYRKKETNYDGYRVLLPACECCCIWWGINQSRVSIWMLKLQGIDWWSFCPIPIICFLYQVLITTCVTSRIVRCCFYFVHQYLSYSQNTLCPQHLLNATIRVWLKRTSKSCISQKWTDIVQLVHLWT